MENSQEQAVTFLNASSVTFVAKDMRLLRTVAIFINPVS
jgi:hypothetical protein